jgi:hypothetical protein
VRFSLAALSLLVLGVGLLVAARGISHDVRVMDAEELAEILGVAPFETISERQLLVDATFTGVVHRGAALYSTYDRSAPPRKRACPT